MHGPQSEGNGGEEVVYVAGVDLKVSVGSSAIDVNVARLGATPSDVNSTTTRL